MKKLYVIIIFFATITCSNAQSNIVGYEYWFNSDYANKTITMVASTQHLTINQTVSALGLFEGVNSFNFRSFDDLGRYSSTLTQFFYKTNVSENNSNPEIVAYEYWIDNDCANVVLVNTPIQQHFVINELISMSNLSNGVHIFNIRFKDNVGLWSSISRNQFFKTPEQIVTQNMITECRYWFTNDFENAKYLSLAPNQQINLIENIDFTQKPKGFYEINFQFKDTLGRWSVVLTDTAEKISLPISNFSYSSTQHCDSTTITFVNNSIDGDSNFWDFGDGTTSTEVAPEHVYHTVGSYMVSLTVTDILTLTDSTTFQTIEITGNTYATVDTVACGSFISPTGSIYNASGTYTDTLSNYIGCDSIVTINLTIKPIPDVIVTQSEITLTVNQVGATYQWLDCDNGFVEIENENGQSFTPTQNGNYAVEATLNGCAEISDCYAVTTVGILENTFNYNVALYPNPTNGKITIDLGAVYDNIVLTVKSHTGQVVKQKYYKNQQVLELNLDVPNGVYFISLASNNKKAILKIVKQ